MKSFQHQEYVVFHDIYWSSDKDESHVKCWITDLKQVWHRRFIGLQALRRESAMNLSLFSSSETEMLITKILAEKLLQEADSVEIELCEWFTNDKREKDDAEIAESLQSPPSRDYPGLILKLFGSLESTMGSSWTFEACQMRPAPASEFIHEYLTIPMIRLNQLMCKREATILDHLNLVKEQLLFTESLYRAEMKREPPKMIDAHFDMERFQSWKDVDWKTVAGSKRMDLDLDLKQQVVGPKPKDELSRISSSSVLSRIDMFTRKRRDVELVEREEERKRREEEAARMVSSTSAASHQSAAAGIDDQSLAEQLEIRRLKREAELERVKQKQQKKQKIKF